MSTEYENSTFGICILTHPVPRSLRPSHNQLSNAMLELFKSNSTLIKQHRADMHLPVLI